MSDLQPAGWPDGAESAGTGRADSEGDDSGCDGWIAPDVLRSALAEIRADLTGLDAQIIELLDRRIQVAKRVQITKAAGGKAIYDPEREAAVIRDAGSEAAARGLDTEAVREIFWRVVRMTREASVD